MSRRPARVWQTTTFRLAVLFSMAFGVGTAALLLVLDLAIGRFAEQTARDALRDQLTVLKADADMEGGEALVETLRAHVVGGQLERFSYLVITPQGDRLEAGLPASVEGISGWGKIRLPSVVEIPGADPTTLEIILLTERATDGTFIAVGRDTYALEELREWLHRLAVWGGALLIILGLAAGVAGGWLFLSRLQRVSAAAQRVVSGHLGERLPSLGFGREFDDLADTLNAMLDQLERTVHALRQVSADVAHDLRTPLTRLRNTLEDAQAAPQRDELLADAISETDRLLEIFGALLRLAQIEGTSDGRRVLVDLPQVVENVVEAYRSAAEEDGRRLNLMIRGRGLVHGDATLLSQAVANLIDNAIIHGAGGQGISVSVIEAGGRIVVDVRDDGPGAPETEIRRLTQRFYRLDRSRNTPGTGLGLSMVAAIASRHHAQLDIIALQPGLLVRMNFPSAT